MRKYTSLLGTVIPYTIKTREEPAIYFNNNDSLKIISLDDTKGKELMKKWEREKFIKYEEADKN